MLHNNEQNSFSLLKEKCTWGTLECSNHPSSPAEAGIVKMTLSCMSLQFPRNAHACLIVQTNMFSLCFHSRYAKILMSTKLDTAHCKHIQIIPRTPRKHWCFILLQRQKITETSTSHPLHNLGLHWTWSKGYEEEKDAGAVTTGAHLDYSLWPIYLQVATRITTPRGWWFVGIEEKDRFLRRSLKG